ncbi:MAG: hypothetical protein WCC30_05825, partial [Candidatus Dormiibacterota bacterium]
PPASPEWTAATRRAYREFVASPAVFAIKPAEVPLVTRYFDMTSRIERLWDAFATAKGRDARDLLLNVNTLQRLVLMLGREIGLSPLARRNLGVQSDPTPPNRLDMFLAEERR